MSWNADCLSSSMSSDDEVPRIEHLVSKMDTLAGVAIKYGVEVADIKRMNGLATDLQMFALKSLHIPPGKHPLSSSSSNGFASLGCKRTGTVSSRQCHSKTVIKPFDSPKLKLLQQNTSNAMNTLQSYYGLKPSNHKPETEGTEMTVYRMEKTDCSKHVPSSHKMEPESGGYSAITVNGLALRPKSTNRAALGGDADLNFSNSVQVGFSDSYADLLSGVWKLPSTSNIQDRDTNSSSIWQTSKWNLKPDLQSLSSVAIARPLLDGLPKPITGLWNKAARD